MIWFTMKTMDTILSKTENLVGTLAFYFLCIILFYRFNFSSQFHLASFNRYTFVFVFVSVCLTFVLFVSSRFIHFVCLFVFFLLSCGWSLYKYWIHNYKMLQNLIDKLYFPLIVYFVEFCCRSLSIYVYSIILYIFRLENLITVHF